MAAEEKKSDGIKLPNEDDLAEQLPFAQGRRPQNDSFNRTVSVQNFKTNELEKQFKAFDELQSLQSRDLIS